MNYQKVYDQICLRAKEELELRKKHKQEGGYYEGHHILPHCLGGKGSSKNWDHPNIVPLTAREHFICHWLLARITDNPKLWNAFHAMCHLKDRNQQRYIPSSRTIEEARIKAIDFIKELHTGKKRPPGVGVNISKATKGLKRSEETRAKLRKAASNRTQETFDKISKSNTGKKRSPESIEKSRQARIGRAVTEEARRNCEIKR